MTKEVCLTHEGLSRLAIEQDFCLGTDDMRDTIKCSRSQILFISPLISKLMHVDPTIKRFDLKTAGSSKCSEILRSLINGSPVKVAEDLVTTFRSIALELGSDELFSNVQDGLTTGNVLEIHEMKHKFSFHKEREVEFIASHFYELPHSDISSLDISTIDSILSSKSLVVSSEHDLFEFVANLIQEHGDKYRILLSHLRLEYLDSEDIYSFIALIDEEHVNALLPCIYRRLVCPLANYKVQEGDKERFQRSVINFKGDKFDGIFSHLWKEANGNPVIKGVVDIVETTGNTQHYVSNLIDSEKRDLDDWECITSDDSDGAFVFDFKDKRVSLNSYSLQANPEMYYNDFIRSWKVEGSNDNSTWTIVDQQSSDVLQSCKGHWTCKESPPFRYFRIMMTDSNTAGYNQIGLHAIEFFGSIKRTQEIIPE